MITRRGMILGSLLGLTGCGGAVLELASAGERLRRTLVVDGVPLALELGTESGASPAQLEAWVRRGAIMVARVAGQLPVPHQRVRVITGGPGTVGFGQHTREGHILVIVGRATSRRDLERDAVMVHELLHTAFPRLALRHRWMREGLSTYLETVLRARAGILSPRSMWDTWRRRMPLGLPGPGARGLDHTRTWAATYWGGALFWFLVDVELRTRGRSLDAVVRGVVEAGGDARVRWPMARVLEVADAVTGTNVVSERYAAMGARAGGAELDALFARLGVIDDDGLALSDDAPGAAIRRAITAPRIALPPIP